MYCIFQSLFMDVIGAACWKWKCECQEVLQKSLKRCLIVSNYSSMIILNKTIWKYLSVYFILCDDHEQVDIVCKKSFNISITYIFSNYFGLRSPSFHIVSDKMTDHRFYIQRSYNEENYNNNTWLCLAPVYIDRTHLAAAERCMHV